MKTRERIEEVTQRQNYDYGYLWCINHVSCYYEVVMVKLDEEPGYWDCWINPYQGQTIHYSKGEFEDLVVYSTPDEALFDMLKSDKYNTMEWTPERIKGEVQSYLDYDGKRVKFMFGEETITEKLLELDTVDEFSDFVEAHCEDVLTMFEF